jgi:transposase-like protein
MIAGPSQAAKPHDVWHLDKVVISIAGKKHWLWRAVDQDDLSWRYERHDIHKRRETGLARASAIVPATNQADASWPR